MGAHLTLILEALIAASLGFLVYLAIPVVTMTAPIRVRERVGRFYMKLGAKALKQFALVRRVLSGYDVKPINVDDEQKLLKITLTSSTMGEDNEYRFADPDNRIKRLWNKPVALNYEEVPAAVDADLAEWGRWVREKHTDDGLVIPADERDGETPMVDPYVEVPDGLYLIDPIDTFELVANDVDPENVKTAEKITKKRYEKYGEGISLKQTMRAMLAYGVGVGGVMAIQYLNQEVLVNSGNGTIKAPTLIIDFAHTIL